MFINKKHDFFSKSIILFPVERQVIQYTDNYTRKKYFELQNNTKQIQFSDIAFVLKDAIYYIKIRLYFTIIVCI